MLPLLETVLPLLDILRRRTPQLLQRRGVVEVVEVAQDDDAGFRVRGLDFADEAQDFGELRLANVLAVQRRGLQRAVLRCGPRHRGQVHVDYPVPPAAGAAVKPRQKRLPRIIVRRVPRRNAARIKVQHLVRRDVILRERSHYASV